MSPRSKKEIITVKPMMMLPARPGHCQTCAIKHEPHMPHDATTLYYLTKFKLENDREATWEDAFAHCTEEMKEIWREELGKLGIDSKSTQVRGPR